MVTLQLEITTAHLHMKLTQMQRDTGVWLVTSILAILLYNYAAIPVSDCTRRDAYTWAITNTKALCQLLSQDQASPPSTLLHPTPPMFSSRQQQSLAYDPFSLIYPIFDYTYIDTGSDLFTSTHRAYTRSVNKGIIWGVTKFNQIKQSLATTTSSSSSSSSSPSTSSGSYTGSITGTYSYLFSNTLTKLFVDGVSMLPLSLEISICTLRLFTYISIPYILCWLLVRLLGVTYKAALFLFITLICYSLWNIIMLILTSHVELRYMLIIHSCIYMAIYLCDSKIAWHVSLPYSSFTATTSTSTSTAINIRWYIVYILVPILTIISALWLGCLNQEEEALLVYGGYSFPPSMSAASSGSGSGVGGSSPRKGGMNESESYVCWKCMLGVFSLVVGDADRCSERGGAGGI